MKNESPIQMFQIQCSDNKGAMSNNWLAYDGAEFTEERADFEVAQCQKFCPRHTYKKIPSGSAGGPSRVQIGQATQNHNRPMSEVLKDGDHLEIQTRFDQNSRNADTGKLYMPSQKWSVTLLHRNGAVCSVGGNLGTKSAAEENAKRNAEEHFARCFVFSRKQSGCKLVSVHYWDDKNQFVISGKVEV